MGKVQAPDNGTQSGILLDMVQSLREYDRMRDGDVPIEDTERRGVKGSRGEEARHKVNIPRSVAIRRDVNSQKGYDLIYYHLL